MALDEKYIALTLLNEYFVDKDSGEPLANGTLEFYRDTARNTPKTVYELTKSGGVYSYTALPNPVTLSAVGTAENASNDNVAIYAYPYQENAASGELDLDLYYIVCKNSDGTEQWTREAVPNLTDTNDPVDDNASGNNNQLANPQFTRYLLDDAERDLTVTGTDDVFPIAPDWDLVASGSGTVNIQRTAVAGNDAIPTYPPYYISVTAGVGITSVYLRQRFNKNSGVWSGKFLTGFVVAKTGSGNNGLTMTYKDSSGATSDVDIFSASLTTGWDDYGGSIQLGNSSNTASGSDAYVDIVIDLPLENTTDITSLQLVVSDAEIAQDVNEFQEQTANREQALMGDWYIPKLEYKPLPSFLVGWDFTLNPAQLGVTGTLTAGAANTAYIWDQTIAQSLAGNLAYARNSITNGIQLTTAADNQTFLLMQYLDSRVAKNIVGTNLSVNVNGWKTAAGSDATIRVYLISGRSAATFPTLPTIIGTLSSDGTFGSLSANWTEIPRSNLPVATAVLKEITNNSDINTGTDYGFSGWEITDNTQIGDTDKFAIVVTCVVPSSGSVITFDSISVVQGEIPTRPAYQTPDQVMQECEYYYERSYERSTATGTATTTNAVFADQFAAYSAPNLSLVAKNFSFRYKTEKRGTPTITFYSTLGATAARLAGYTRADAGAVTNAEVTLAGNWTSGYIGLDAAFYTTASASAIVGPTNTGGTTYNEAYLLFHYVADARLGV